MAAFPSIAINFVYAGSLTSSNSSGIGSSGGDPDVKVAKELISIVESENLVVLSTAVSTTSVEGPVFVLDSEGSAVSLTLEFLPLLILTP
jgi:hypothetical protein